MNLDDYLRRVSELCDGDEMERTGLEGFARDVWLAAQETNLGQLSKESLVAFAEVTCGGPNRFVDAHDLFALRVRLEGIDRPYYVMTEPRIDEGRVFLDLHPAPIDVILREHEAADRVRHWWRWHIDRGPVWLVLLLDNEQGKRHERKVLDVTAVRVRRRISWSEA